MITLNLEKIIFKETHSCQIVMADPWTTQVPNARFHFHVDFLQQCAVKVFSLPYDWLAFRSSNFSPLPFVQAHCSDQMIIFPIREQKQLVYSAARQAILSGMTQLQKLIREMTVNTRCALLSFIKIMVRKSAFLPLLYINVQVSEILEEDYVIISLIQREYIQRNDLEIPELCEDNFSKVSLEIKEIRIIHRSSACLFKYSSRTQHSFTPKLCTSARQRAGLRGNTCVKEPSSHAEMESHVK